MTKPVFDVDPKERVVSTDLGPNQEWRAQMQWGSGELQGGPAIVLLQPNNPGDSVPDGGISHTLLREIDFRAALDALRRSIASADEWRTSREESTRRVLGLLKEHASSPNVTDDYLALLARAYVGAVNQGKTGPLQYLAEVTGKTPAAIKNHLWRSTRSGFLERSPGRAGGHVTNKGAAVLTPLLDSARAKEGLPPLALSPPLTPFS